MAGKAGKAGRAGMAGEAEKTVVSYISSFGKKSPKWMEFDTIFLVGSCFYHSLLLNEM